MQVYECRCLLYTRHRIGLHIKEKERKTGLAQPDFLNCVICQPERVCLCCYFMELVVVLATVSLAAFLISL